MFAFAFVGVAGGGEDPAVISAAWSDITDTFGPGGVTNEDRTITFIGPARTVTAASPPSGTLAYRIDSGSYVTYSGGFSLTSGQTLGWRFAGSENLVATPVPVSVNGALLDTFNISATGWP